MFDHIDNFYASVYSLISLFDGQFDFETIDIKTIGLSSPHLQRIQLLPPYTPIKFYIKILTLCLTLQSYIRLKKISILYNK